jgi:hypothetical protein
LHKLRRPVDKTKREDWRRKLADSERSLVKEIEAWETYAPPNQGGRPKSVCAIQNKFPRMVKETLTRSKHIAQVWLSCCECNMT